MGELKNEKLYELAKKLNPGDCFMHEEIPKKDKSENPKNYQRFFAINFGKYIGLTKGKDYIVSNISHDFGVVYNGYSTAYLFGKNDQSTENPIAELSFMETKKGLVASVSFKTEDFLVYNKIERLLENMTNYFLRR